jgi:hypothetical protein
VGEIINDSTCVREIIDELSNDDDGADDARLRLTSSYFEPMSTRHRNQRHT